LNTQSKIKLLFVGDIIGKPGRYVASRVIPQLIKERELDFVIANGENAAGGFGLTKNIVGKLHSYGIDCITTGNHVWDRKEFIKEIEECSGVLRPANYPPGAPGRGYCIIEKNGKKLGVVNLQGRVFMDPIDCPFRVGRDIVEKLREEVENIVIDFHAEATAEKIAFFHFMDGKVAAIFGTHTHVPTADEAILPGGTGVITDVGMTGPFDSVIGMKKEIAIERIIKQLPRKFEPAKKDLRFQGVYVEIAEGKTEYIERIEIRVKKE